MRNPDGTLLGDLNDNLPALTSGSVVFYPSSSLDENQTTYDLLPIVINKAPVIVASITETSNPTIKPYISADGSGKYMYISPDDSVKVNLGSNLTLKLKAEQPRVFNVENGIPKIIPSSANLTYVWKKDGIVVVSYTLSSLGSEMIVNGDSIIFKNIQPEHAGSYSCEVSNDIGATVSEVITLEILNLDFDSYFYRNLVLNPYGKEGTDNWESTSPDLISKQFSTTPSQDFLRPYRVDLFGYTQDMLHPRPYQIDTGVEKGFDMVKDLLHDGTYFTRTKYSYVKNGGTFLVRAYQDIDLTEIEPLIRGSVWGIEGIRAMFSCYIGNSLGPYIPVTELVDIRRRTNLGEYIGYAPRVSIENFLHTGPNFGPTGEAYVTLEEFDNETRLVSTVLKPDGVVEIQPNRITFKDPWTKRMGNYWSQKYYVDDKFGIGQTSLGDARDMVLFTADELMPDITKRYTQGQYVEFNKVILDKLNPKTTKIRITLQFETADANIFWERDKKTLQETDNTFEFIGWQFPYKRDSFDLNKSGDSIRLRQSKLLINAGKSEGEYVPASPDPGVMVTALNLMLLPVLTQNKEETDYYTNTTLVKNETPESIVPNGLYWSPLYDPFGRRNG